MMKYLQCKYLSCLLVCAFVAVSAGAQSVRFLETEHDFGAFAEDDGKVSTDFKFINESSEPLTIKHVRSSCGCTVPEYSKAKIQPGDTASVTVVYNPTGRPGRFSKSLVVKLSDDTEEHLGIKGVVIGSQNTLQSRFPLGDGPIRLRSNIVTFGSVKVGRLKSQYLEVYNASSQPQAPTWTDIPAWLRIKAAHDTINPGEQGVYSMVLTPTKSTPYGLLTDSITFNVDGQPPMKIEIAAIVEEDFSLMSKKQLEEAPKVAFDVDMLDFGDFTPESAPITRQLRITNTGKSELAFRRIYTTEPGMTVKVPVEKLKKGKSTTVTVTFDPASFTAPLLNSRLQVITNDPSNPMAVIRLVGIGR